MRRLASLPLLILALLAMLGQWMHVGGENVRVREATRDDLQDKLSFAVGELERITADKEGKARALAWVLETDWAEGDIDDDQVRGVLEAWVDQEGLLYGAGLTTELDPPAGIDSVVYAPYCRRPYKDVTCTDVPYDPRVPPAQGSDDPETRWFTQPRASPGGLWIEPFFVRTSQTPLVAYGYGFELPHGGGPAVVSLNLSLATMHEIVALMDLGEMGYAYLFSDSGRMIVHPRPDLVELNGLDDPDDRAEWIVEVTEPVHYEDPLTHQPSWRACETVAGPDWTVCIVAQQVPGHEARLLLRNKLVMAGLICGVLVLFFVAIRPRRAWEASAALSLGNVGLIGSVWVLTALNPCYEYRTLNDSAPEEGELLLVTSRSSAAQHYTAYSGRQRAEVRDDITPISTGIFLQSLDFSDANDVAVTGYVWQRGDAPGVILPEAVEGGLSDEPAYVEDGVTGWYFETTLRQSMEYRRFPFDQKEVWIRLWSSGFADHVMLVPDFDSYREQLPGSRPGVAEGFVLPGWTLDQSYFAYRYYNYSTNFGVENYSGQSNSPELHFAVQLRRSLLDAFVAHIIPLAVVLGLLFLVLWRGVLERLGATELVGASSGLFFVVLLAHIQLREQLQSPDIVYLECAYLLSYLFILLVALITVVESIRLQDIDENEALGPHLSKRYLFAQLLYWPVFSTAFALVTLWFLY